ncbi:MBL fold metallo-hydrolase [Actinomadura madurae]|uniref:MBL fold metallo-hydrolase n=1 Tax=Actinomadura madurae TaxID=1993 RepID=UPI0020D25EB8|nr:MBL fold metallo-hydrolase [Actinomadura madurae]
MPDAWLDDGQRLTLTERGLDVFATPGHTRGHIVLRDAGAGLLFAGDHILPHITPSIGLETEPEPKPLRSYLESLRLVRGMPDTLLLPAHGPVTPSVHTRVDQLLEHHAERLEIAAAQVRAGPRHGVRGGGRHAVDAPPAQPRRPGRVQPDARRPGDRRAPGRAHGPGRAGGPRGGRGPRLRRPALTHRGQGAGGRPSYDDRRFPRVEGGAR